MKKHLLHIILALGAVLLVGCGGGGGGEGGINEIIVPEEIKVIDLEGKTKVKITKSNALNLMEGSKLSIPLGLERYVYDEIFSQNTNEELECSISGKASIKTNNVQKSISIDFSRCDDEEGVILDGLMYVIFNKFESAKEEGYFLLQDFKYTTGTQSIVLNVESDTRVDEKGTRTNKYYVEAKNLQNNEVFKYNYKVENNETDRSISGVFLLPDDTYYTLQSKNLEGLYSLSPFIGGLNLDFYDGIVGEGQIILSGESSELVYQKANGIDFFRLRENLNEIKPYYLTEIEEWTTNLDIITSNGYEGQLYISVIDENESYAPYTYSPYQNESTFPYYIKTYESESHLNIRVTDEDQYGEYIVQIEPLSIPFGSKFSMDKTKYLLDYIFDYTGDFQREADASVNHLVTFDKNGIYKFKITMQDGDKIVERELFIEYNNAKGLSNTETKLPYVAHKKTYLDSSKQSILLTDNNIVVIDELGNEQSVNVLNPTDFAISSDNNFAYATTGTRVAKINLNNMSIEMYYELGVDERQETFETIISSGETIYVRNSYRLYRLELNTGVMTPILYGSLGLVEETKIFINTAHNRLYVASLPGNIVSLERPVSTFSGTASVFSYIEDFREFNNVWEYDENNFITSQGELFNITDSNETDLTSNGQLGFLDIYNENIDIEYQDNELIHFLKNEKTDDMLFVVKKWQDDFIEGDYISAEQIEKLYFLKIYSPSLKLEYEGLLRNEYVANNKRYQVTVKNAHFIGDDKVSILYDAYEYLEDSVYLLSTDASFSIEDILVIK